MKKPRIKNEVYNTFVFTVCSLHSWTIEGLDEHQIQYVGFGLEVCPKTGKDHHQGWIYCNTSAKKSFKVWKKLFVSFELEKMHFEQMKGSFVEHRVC